MSKPKQRPPIIAIDGPAGAGKSTIAKRLAQALNFLYIDTGAMYRAVTLKAMREKIPMTDQTAVETLARKLRLEFIPGKIGTILMDGEDVSTQIRTPEVSRNVSAYVASYPGVRQVMVAQQQAMGAQGGVVMEGRDITTVVFPQAEFKIYLDASQEERAKRRYQELKQQGREQPYAEMLRDLQQRDREDLNRPGGALQCIADARRIDTTNMTLDQVLSAILQVIPKAMKD